MNENWPKTNNDFNPPLTNEQMEQVQEVINQAIAKQGDPSSYIFRVIREKVGDVTVRVLLEPYTDIQHVELSDGDEFITGTLKTSPWEES